MKLLSILTAIISLFVFSSCESEQAKLEKQLIGKWENIGELTNVLYFNEGGTGVQKSWNMISEEKAAITERDLEWLVTKIDGEEEFSIIFTVSGEDTSSLAKINGLFLEYGSYRLEKAK